MARVEIASLLQNGDKILSKLKEMKIDLEEFLKVVSQRFTDGFWMMLNNSGHKSLKT